MKHSTSSTWLQSVVVTQDCMSWFTSPNTTSLCPDIAVFVHFGLKGHLQHWCYRAIYTCGPSLDVSIPAQISHTEPFWLGARKNNSNKAETISASLKEKLPVLSVESQAKPVMWTVSVISHSHNMWHSRGFSYSDGIQVKGKKDI